MCKWYILNYKKPLLYLCYILNNFLYIYTICSIFCHHQKGGDCCLQKWFWWSQNIRAYFDNNILLSMANNIFCKKKDYLKTLNLIEDHLSQEKSSLKRLGIRKIIFKKSSKLSKKSSWLWHGTSSKFWLGMHSSRLSQDDRKIIF